MTLLICLGRNAISETDHSNSSSCLSTTEMTEAAERGDLTAQLMLSKYYLERSNSDLGIKWLTLAAEQGDKVAQAKVGDFYFDKKSGHQNFFEGAKWLLKAAEQGDVESQKRLASLYTDGNGVPKDKYEASRWTFSASTPQDKARITLAAAVSSIPASAPRASREEYLIYAEQGSSLAQYTLGRMYFDAPYGERNEGLGLEWLRRAAGQGHTQATKDLAEILARSVSDNGAQKEATELFRSVGRFDKLGVAKLQVGLSYQFGAGRGVPRNDLLAFYWMREAAELGYAAAQRQLGRLYLRGDGTAADAAQAKTWFERAAEQLDAPAQYSLAEIYLNVNGVERDVRRAYFWWKLSTSSGYVGGELNAPDFWSDKIKEGRQDIDMSVAAWREKRQSNQIKSKMVVHPLCLNP